MLGRSSPSVYVAFESLHARDYCGNTGANGGTITFAFDPGELSTTVGYKWDTDEFSDFPPTMGSENFTQANWGDQ